MRNPEVDVSLLAFGLASLAVWRVTHLLHAEDGPWALVAGLRRRAGAGVLGTLFDCFNCLSVWIALPFVPWLTAQWGTGIVVWAALSGLAIVVERLTDRAPPPAAWHEEPPPP